MRQAAERALGATIGKQMSFSMVSTSFMSSVVLVAFVAAALLAKGFVPSWRNKWGWGRGNSIVPITLIGHFGITVAFVLIALGTLATVQKVNFPFAWALPILGFVVFICAGIHDSIKAGRKNK